MLASHRRLAVVVGLALLIAVPGLTTATHSWGNYHWARTSNPFTLTVVDSMTADWDGKLNTAITDWNTSSVMDVVKGAGDSSAKARKRCAAISGKVRACNATYGYNGWLGLAQIWASGSHITQAVAKMNDSYLASSRYTERNRQHVICQELGHDWGLGHQDESGADLNTCMDYDRALDNPSPNAHDYAQLVTIYGSHTESTTTIKAMPQGFLNADVSAQAAWGRMVARSADGSTAVFVREFGNGFRIITHVFWA